MWCFRNPLYNLGVIPGNLAITSATRAIYVHGAHHHDSEKITRLRRELEELREQVKKQAALGLD